MISSPCCYRCWSSGAVPRILGLFLSATVSPCGPSAPAAGSRPAVWTVDPATRIASLRPVAVGGYEAGEVLIKAGLDPGERVVVDGGKLLSVGQAVTYEGNPS